LTANQPSEGEARFSDREGRELFTVGGGARPLYGVSNLDDCRASCGTEPTCKAFEFKRDDRTCRLFSQVERSAANPLFYSGIRLTANQPSEGEARFSEREGRELFTVGGGARPLYGVSNLDDCRASCGTEPTCKAFEFKRDDRTCRLFSQVERSAPNPLFYSGIR
jgi:hypothetical protein